MVSHLLSPSRACLYAAADVGQAGLSHLVARPNLFCRLPRLIQDRWGKRAIRPAGAGWLNPRCQPIRITTSRIVTSAVPQGHRLVLTLNDGTKRHVDHAMPPTGYGVNIAHYPFLSKPVAQKHRHRRSASATTGASLSRVIIPATIRRYNR